MFKNLKQTNFKLQNLDQVYTRLLNKKIEHAQIKKVNSVTKIIGAQAKILNNINYYIIMAQLINPKLLWRQQDLNLSLFCAKEVY